MRTKITREMVNNFMEMNGEDMDDVFRVEFGIDVMTLWRYRRSDDGEMMMDRKIGGSPQVHIIRKAYS